MSGSIDSYVSRYVVPFYFNYDDNGYETICRFFADYPETNAKLDLPNDGKWEEVGFWENYRSNKSSQAEMDLYSYLPTIFAETHDGKETDIANLGNSFVYKTNGRLFDLEYKCRNMTIPFYCQDLGVVLLRNGIAFIWYEIRFKNVKSVSAEDYYRFQNDFKELARTHKDTFVKKVRDEETGETRYEPFVLGLWLSNLISSEKMGIRFWAERITKKGTEKICIPDKALLFQYMFISEATESETNDLLFRIANGYNDKYNTPKNLHDYVYRPFGNVSFYITKAGMACVVTNEDTNREFFKGEFREKYIRDFFFIYILLSYQSYSCAHYSRLLTKLPAEEMMFDETNIRKLEALNGQINLFLVKSVFDSVSNIHHQNGVYRYGKGELCIEEDIRSLTIGLSALEEMENDKRKQKELKEKEAEKEEQEKRYREERARRETEKEEQEKRYREERARRETEKEEQEKRYREERARRETEKEEQEKRYREEQAKREAEKEEQEKRYQAEQKKKEEEKDKEEKKERKINRALTVFGFMVVVSAWIDGLNLVDWFRNNGTAIEFWHIGVSVFVFGLTIYLIIILLWNRRDK